MTAAEKNAIAKSLYSMMDEYLGAREMLPGGGAIYSAVFADAERRAWLGLEPFLKEHQVLLDRFSTARGTAGSRHERAILETDVRSIVLKVFGLEAPKLARIK